MAEIGEIMAKNAKVDYDSKCDSLYVFTGRKANDSIELGNYVVDFDNDEKVSGIEIFDISKMLGVSKPMIDLAKVKDAQLNVSQSKSSIYVMVLLRAVMAGKSVEKELIMSVPRVSEIKTLN